MVLTRAQAAAKAAKVSEIESIDESNNTNCATGLSCEIDNEACLSSTTNSKSSIDKSNAKLSSIVVLKPDHSIQNKTNNIIDINLTNEVAPAAEFSKKRDLDKDIPCTDTNNNKIHEFIESNSEIENKSDVLNGISPNTGNESKSAENRVAELEAQLIALRMDFERRESEIVAAWENEYERRVELESLFDRFATQLSISKPSQTSHLSKP